MSITFKKQKIGYQDILWDSQGNWQTFPTYRSDGTYRMSEGLNASHIPVTITVRGKNYADGTAVTATDVDSVIVQMLDDLEDLGQPDGTTLEVASGALGLKDGGISTVKLGSNVVTQAKMGALSVGTPELIDDSVDSAKLKSDSSVSANRAVTANHIQDGAVGEDALAASAVTSAKVAADAIDITKLDMDGSGTAPQYFCIYAGKTTVSSGASVFNQPVSSVDDSVCLVIASMASAASHSLSSSILSSPTNIQFTFSGTLTSGGTVHWQILKPTV